MRHLPPLLLLALALAYFFPALASGTLLAPGDGTALNFPLRVLVAEALKAGEVPFWNPYAFGGTPLLAGIHEGVFFPGNWPFLLLPPTVAMNTAVLGAYWLAGWGVYALARTLGQSAAAAMVAAVVFMFGGFMVAHLDHLQMIQAAGLTPWMLTAIARFGDTGRSRWAIALAVLLGLQILAGHPQMVAFGLLLAGAFALWRGWGRGARFFAPLGAALVLGVGLSLAQLAPALDFIPLTQRQAISWEQLTVHSLSPKHWGLFLVPYMFGGLPTPLFPVPYWGGTYANFIEYTGYVGLLPLMLTAVALVRWREPGVRFWAAVAAVGLLLAAGKHTPLYVLWAQLPVLNSMPGAGRHVFEVTLALALLAGYGVGHFERAAPAQRRRAALLAGGAVGLALVGLVAVVQLNAAAIVASTQPFLSARVDLASALRLSQPTWWLPLACGLAGALALAALAWRPGRPAQAFALAVVLGDLAVFGHHLGWRQLSPAAADFTLAAPVPATETRTIAVPRIAFPYYDLAHVRALRLGHWSMLEGARSLNGYHPLIPAWYGAALDGSNAYVLGAGIWSPDHRGLDLFAVRELRLAPETAAQPLGRGPLASGRWALAQAEADVIVYANRQALPRAWRPDRAIVLDRDRLLTVIRTGAFAPAAEALLEAPLEASGLTGGPVSAETRSLNRITLTTEGAGPGLVIVSEGYDPGWRAYAGGRALPVHRADGMLLGVEVPAGRQAVELVYEPRAWRAGLAGSCLSLALLVAWGWRARRYRRSVYGPACTTPAGKSEAKPRSAATSPASADGSTA